LRRSLRASNLSNLNDRLLITGPPASGKSRATLDRFLARPDSLLLAPTATMAEHVRHELARANVAVRPSRIVTLAQFLDQCTRLAAAPEPVLDLLIEEALERIRPPDFAAVAGFPGFRRAVAKIFEEASAGALSGDLLALFREVEAGLAARGMALRNVRLRDARPSPPAHVALDGFFSFAPAELALIEASGASVTVTLPDWPGAAPARERLLALGFAEQRLSAARRAARVDRFSALTLEHETEEIARRILKEASQGRRFREMGIILRTREPYGPALETTLARFGIPARFYFSDVPAAHPAVQYLSGLVEALLRGWDHAGLLTLLRMPVSGVGATPAGDRFDFALRERFPGAGLPIRGIDGVPPVLDSLAALDPWRRDRLSPQDWAAQLKTLRALVPPPVVTDGVSRDQAHIWRSTAAALDAFDAAFDGAASALAGTGPIPLAEFWKRASVALTLEKFRLEDRRRDVVHVLDVYEARQWELPVAFVCGLVERHFPQYHREDALLNDAARRRAGLPTSTDRQDEERFLFELATSRATEATILSYARFNDQGGEALPSFFLGDEEAPLCWARIRPRPQRSLATAQPIAIQDAAMLRQLSESHNRLSPTSIESFLQCPFQFFAAKTLRLRARPPAPRDRLDMLLQGTILHEALAEFVRHPLLGAAVFDPVFEDRCRRARIPPGLHREAVRLELLRHFEAFLEDRQFALSWTRRVEEKFSFALNPLVTISGRIDRLEVGPANQALVIDYKYSAPERIRERIEDPVQGGLYLLAAEREFGLAPAGMLYCGLRNQVSWEGWHAGLAGLGVGESTTSARLRELMDAAAQTAAEVHEAIVSGRIAVAPADRGKCEWCDFRDICRVETVAEALEARQSWSA
jgi:RecB family exonuclease